MSSAFARTRRAAAAVKALLMSRELHVRTHPSRVEHWRHVAEIVAIVAAAIWGLYVFVYQESIKPASQPPELQPTYTVEHTILPDGNEFVKVRTELRNNGSSTIYIAGLIMNIYGERFENEDASIAISPSLGPVYADRTLKRTAPVFLYGTGSLLQPFGRKSAFINIQPSTSFNGFGNFALHPREYDVVTVHLEWCFTKYANMHWRARIVREQDGSYAIDDEGQANKGPALLCYVAPGQAFSL